MTCAKKQNSGFTLIEALVTMVLLASGLLGMIALQAKTLKFNQNAYYRTQATLLAYDMADRIRANPAQGIDLAKVSRAELKKSKYFKKDEAVLKTTCLSSTSGCTPTEMALNDYKQWLNNLAGTLPGGDGTITLYTDADESDDDVPIFNITVSWDDNTKKEGDPAPTDETYANKVKMSFQL